jgi:protein-tyrosine phosphatase
MVVSLLESEEARDLALQEEKREVEAAGIQYESFPIVDRGVPDSVSTMVHVLEEVKQELVAGRNVAVHCRQGIGRSGLVAAGLLMVSGISAAEALGMVRLARGVDVPETAQQRAWVEGLLAEHLALVRH